MAQSGYTPISFYYSTTAAATPTSGNLVNGEIAINTADGVIYYKNTGGTVVPLSFGSAAVSWQSVQASSFTAAAGKGYPVNTTSAGVTATLPASPTAGQAVGFVDYAGTFATYNLTINPNGSKILGATGNVIVTTNRESLLFVYIDSTKGWLPYAGFLGSNPAPATYTITYLLVAGGAGGGNNLGGGGGAGGLLSGSVTGVTQGTVYSFTVGGGGNAQSAGNNTTGFSLTATGGGTGGTNSGTENGTSGGSGGGACGSGTSRSGGSGTSGQGNRGGNNNNNSPYPAGGGGGSGAAGGDAGTGGPCGDGGAGTASSITGSSLTYAGGGGGGGQSYTAGGAGGSGGGGAGGGNGSSPTSGSTNLGGGGGGGTNSGSVAGASGGSGVVILSVPTANYSGTTTGSPTVTTSGSNTIIKFTASGSYTA